MIYEICAVAVTLCFIILVAFVIWTLANLSKTLKQAQTLSLESLVLLQNLNTLTDNLQEQINAISPLIKTAGNLGAAVQDFSDSLEKKIPHPKHEKENQWPDKAAKILEIGFLAATLWKQIKNRT